MFRNSVLANSNHNTDPSIINTDTPLTMDHETASAGNQKISEILSYKSTQMYGQRRTFMDSALHYLFGSLSKSIRVLFIIYIIVSLVYTFAHFFTLFHRGQQTTVDTIPSSQSLLQEGQTVVGKIVLDKQPLDSPAGENTADTVLTGRFSLVAEANSSPQSMFHIPHYIITLCIDSIYTAGFSLASLNDVPNNMLISKLFQYALQPTTIIPYYLKMNNNPSHSEITITTMITIERLGVFSGLVNKYRGTFVYILRV